MKHLWLILLLFAAVSAEAQVHISGAFNSKAYFPVVGDPNQVDTIVGSLEDSLLGAGIMNIGPPPGGSYGTISSIINPGATQVTRIESFDCGPDFDLHHLKDNGRLKFHIARNITKIGHFRDTYHNDILTSSGNGTVMYWEDDSGNYDSLNSTELWALLPSNLVNDIHLPQELALAFCAHIYSDSVYDILGEATRLDTTKFYSDSSYLCVVRGGNHLFHPNDTIFADSTTFFFPLYESDTDSHGIHKGHGEFKWDAQLNFTAPGVLSEDNEGNFFYYLRRGKGSLAELAYSLTHDTLIVGASIPDVISPDSLDGIYPMPKEMRVFPKSLVDSSIDLILPLFFRKGLSFGMFMFRGGPDFGTHRLTLDSAAYVFHNPYHYDRGQFIDDNPVALIDCGDMTGRGNHMLCAEYHSDLLYTEYIFYELGTELDDKIDMYYADGPGQFWGIVDTLTANNDGLEDVIVGHPGRYSYDDPAHHSLGTIQIVYGTQEIPKRDLSSVQEEARAGRGITIYPNPVEGGLALLGFDSRDGGTYRLRIRNLLGQAVVERDYHANPGHQSLPLHIPDLTNGTYEAELSNGEERLSTRILVTR